MATTSARICLAHQSNEEHAAQACDDDEKSGITKSKTHFPSIFEFPEVPRGFSGLQGHQGVRHVCGAPAFRPVSSLAHILQRRESREREKLETG